MRNSEVFFGLAFVVIVFVAMVSLSVYSATHVSATAEKWLTANGVKHSTVDCQMLDSDRDGYYSCPYFLEGEIWPLECNLWGCRVPKFGVRR